MNRTELRGEIKPKLMRILRLHDQRPLTQKIDMADERVIEDNLDKLLHLINEYVAGVIGEDEEVKEFAEDECHTHEAEAKAILSKAHNELRAEQRRRAGIGEK